MNAAHVVALVMVTVGCVQSVAAQDFGPISRSLAREAARLAQAPALAHQADSGPSDARWTKLRRHVGDKAVISTRAHGEIRGRLRAPGADAIDVEQGGQVVRIARADVCDITSAESPVARNARWGAVGALAGLGAGYVFNVAQGLADIQF